MKNLPIGIQDFREIIEGGYLYIDKTESIHQLLTGGKKKIILLGINFSSKTKSVEGWEVVEDLTA